MNKFFNNQNGIALIMVIILLAAVGSLVGVLMTSEVFNISFTGREINETKAFYLAEAGVQRVDYLFNKYGKSIFEDDNSLTGEDDEFINQQNLMSLDNYDGSYQITDIQKIESENKVKIEILGKYNNAEKKLGITIDLANEIDLDGLFSNALFAAGNNNDSSPSINMKGNSTKITGDVKTNISDYSSINIKGSIDGDFAMNFKDTPPNNIYQEKQPGDLEWSIENTPYSGGKVVWYDGLYYKALNDGVGSAEPGTIRAWQVKIPDGENWPWFENQIYNSGDKVWYNGELYTAKNGGVRGQKPDSSNGWERQIPNVSGNIEYTEKIDYPDIKFPDFPVLETKDSIETKNNKNGIIDSDGYYENITLKSETDLIIDRDDNDRILRVKDLNIKNGHINFKDPNSEGKLIIYVEDSITFGAGSTLGNLEQKDNVIIHYAGNNKIDFAGDTKFYGSLNVKSADIKLAGSNSINGHIFSGGGDITVSGGVSLPENNSDEGVIIYALNSKLSFKGSGSLKGTAIVDSVELGGNTYINYAKPDLENFPFIQDILDFDNSSGGGNSSGENDKIIWYNK